MEKKHLSSSSGISEETQKRPEPSTTAVTPQKPPRLNRKIVHKVQDNLMTGVHAEKMRHWSNVVYGNQNAFSELETRQTTAVTPQRSLLLKKAIIEDIKNDSVVKVCVEKIQRLSKTVYGSPNALYPELQKILKNPATKDSLLKQIEKSPGTLHVLAGLKIFGIKTNARKEAEKTVSYLCSAIRVYAEAVQHAHQNRNTTFSAEKTAIEKMLFAEKKEDCLSHERVLGLVQSNQNVQRFYRRVQHWSQVIYNKPNIFQKQMEDILENSNTAEQLLWDVARKPQLFGKLTGRRICGFKNNARRCAEANLEYLRDAVKNYAESVQQAKESLSYKQETPQQSIHASTSQKKEIIQERQYAQQRNIPQHRSKGTKRVSFAL